MDGVRAQAQLLYGQVSTLLNRVRSVPEIHSNHPGVRQAAERAAINMPVQGTAADIIKIAMIRVARAMEELGVRSRIILQVHEDGLVFDVPEEEVDAMAHLVRDGMMHALDLAVPLGVEVNVGQLGIDGAVRADLIRSAMGGHLSSRNTMPAAASVHRDQDVRLGAGRHGISALPVEKLNLGSSGERRTSIDDPPVEAAVGGSVDGVVGCQPDVNTVEACQARPEGGGP